MLTHCIKTYSVRAWKKARPHSGSILLKLAIERNLALKCYVLVQHVAEKPSG